MLKKKIEIIIAGILIIVSAARPTKAESQVQGWGRDPFKLVRSDTGVRTHGNLVLHGIMYDMEKPCAIINGVVVSAGEKIEGCTIVCIDEDCVTVDDGTTQYKLKLWE